MVWYSGCLKLAFSSLIVSAEMRDCGICFALLSGEEIIRFGVLDSTGSSCIRPGMCCAVRLLVGGIGVAGGEVAVDGIGGLRIGLRHGIAKTDAHVVARVGVVILDEYRTIHDEVAAAGAVSANEGVATQVIESFRNNNSSIVQLHFFLPAHRVTGQSGTRAHARPHH